MYSHFFQDFNQEEYGQSESKEFEASEKVAFSISSDGDFHFFLDTMIFKTTTSVNLV